MGRGGMANRPIQTNGLCSFGLAEVNAAVAATQFAGRVTHLPVTSSTNDLALSAALAGERSGVWIADQQLAGRGRGSHAWHSSPGARDAPDGLYMTALIAPAIPMQRALGLSLRVAIAVQAAIASTTGFRIPDQIDIRWPNDLMLTGKSGRARKCGGILIDTASNRADGLGSATLRYAILGIGVNVNHTSFPPELDPIATSLRRELPDPAQPLRREPLAAAILVALDAEIQHLSTCNPQPATCTSSDLARISTWISGKRVRVEARDDDPGYTGTTAGLDPSGFLLVAGDDGKLHTVLSGGLREPTATENPH
jgi:BirA family biotin operon repressor/biotin-[acetyl-CoA-carboxylase] ligase